MKNNILSYFKIHLRKSARAIMYMTVIAIVITAISTYGSHSYQMSHYDKDFFEYIGEKTIYRAQLSVASVVMIVASYIAAVRSFSCFMKRRNLDCFYSLPLPRRAIGGVHYAVGIIEMFSIFTASYLTNVITMLMDRGEFNYIYLLPHYFLSLLFGVIMYSVLVFAFNEGTSVADGIIYMVAYTFVMTLLCGALRGLNSIPYDPILSEISTSMLFGGITSMTSVFENAIECDTVIFTSFLTREHIIFWSIVWTVIGIAAAVGFFLKFGKRRPEMTEDISESYFGYKVLIPYTAATLMLAIDSGELLTYIFIELAALIGYTIYRRGFKYKRQDIIVLLALIIFAFI